LQQRIEVADRVETAQPASQTCAPAPAQRCERIENGAVAHEVEHRIDLLGLGDPLGKARALQLDALCAEFL
jgi:hypothetical protein